MKRGIRVGLIILFAGIFVFSLWNVLGILQNYEAGDSSYQDLAQYVSADETWAPVETETQSPELPEETEPTEPPDLSGWPQVDFAALKQINGDCVGWIYIEGTNINYPVAQHSDNSYYLNHLFDGKANNTGCIFLDARNASDYSDKNSILYGHHMKNGSMFRDLVKYKKQAFYDEHSVALLMTETAYYKIQLFSGYVSNNQGDAWDVQFDGALYEEWLEQIQENSCFVSPYKPSVEEQIITLSTCTYEFSGAKFVVHGYVSETIRLAPPVGN